MLGAGPGGRRREAEHERLAAFHDQIEVGIQSREKGPERRKAAKTDGVRGGGRGVAPPKVVNL